MRYFYSTIIFLLLFSLITRGQQAETYSQYVFNQFAINPAVAGSKDCIDIKAGFRKQWLGFEGSPNTKFVTIYAPLKLRKGPAKGLQKKGKHGIGGYIFKDDAGLFSSTKLSVSYAYHVPLSKRRYMSVGIRIGARLQQWKGAQRSNDPLLTAGASSLVLPDITPGIWIYSSKSFLGLSVKNAYKLNMGIGSPAGYRPQVNFTYGKEIKSVKYIYSYVPSVLIKYSVGMPVSVDVNFMMYVNSKFGWGLGFRNTEGFLAQLKYNILPNINVGYAFDWTTSAARLGGSNSHEIILSYSPCGRGSKNANARGSHCAAYD